MGMIPPFDDDEMKHHAKIGIWIGVLVGLVIVWAFYTLVLVLVLLAVA